MWLKLRLFLVALLVGVVVAQMSLASSSDAGAAPVMAMQDGCCLDDCPDMPECDAACIEAMRCGVAPIVLGLEPSGTADGQQTKTTAFLPVRMTANLQTPTDGLQRPPKT